MTTAYGVKLVFVGPMRAPDGTSPVVRTVWIQNSGGRDATLVTAVPVRRS